ncbi:MAG: hypothetical protein L6R39_005683 [Caloplaca ligustica]|nr:MAG: hypothetical protein L6R39_005683 [Caloplaca ligustica]
MDYLALLKTLSFYSFYPIFLVLKFLGLLLFAVSAPFLRLAQYSIQVCMWPLRFLAKFEVRKYLTLYIFVGVGLLVGIMTGATLHYASTFLIAFMDLESQPEEQPRGRTMASYRAGRRYKIQQKNRAPPMPPVATSPRVESTFKDEFANLRERDTLSKRRSLLASTILEEDDSSEAAF